MIQKFNQLKALQLSKCRQNLYTIDDNGNFNERKILNSYHILYREKRWFFKRFLLLIDHSTIDCYNLFSENH